MVTKMGFDFLFSLDEDLSYCTEAEKKSCLTGVREGIALYLAMLQSSDKNYAIAAVFDCFLCGVPATSFVKVLSRSLDRRCIVYKMPSLSLIDNGKYMLSLRKGFEYGKYICNYFLELWGLNGYFEKTVKMIQFQQSVLDLYIKTFFEGLGAS